MKLKEYLDKNNISCEEFSQLTKIPINSIYRWRRGQHKPISIYIKIIERETNYKVTKKDWE